MTLGKENNLEKAGKTLARENNKILIGNKIYFNRRSLNVTETQTEDS